MNLPIQLEELITSKEDLPHMPNDTLPMFPHLAAAMSEQGLTRKMLAASLGISVSSLGRRLQGRIDFRWNELFILHSLFPDMPVSLLLQRREN